MCAGPGQAGARRVTRVSGLASLCLYLSLFLFIGWRSSFITPGALWDGLIVAGSCCRGVVRTEDRGFSQNDVASREAKAVPDHRAVCTALRPGRPTWWSRVHAGGQAFLPPP